MPRRSTSDKILAAGLLRLVRKRWSLRGQRVVFTNGVFDLLHPGHVELLEMARAMGDVLVVGVNTDASARGLGKGPGRPFNRWRDRARVLAALGCVDAVVEFAQPTPERLIRRLRPDVLVKGGDYSLSTVVGRRFARKTVLIPLRAGYSTTRLVDRIATAVRTPRSSPSGPVPARGPS